MATVSAEFTIDNDVPIPKDLIPLVLALLDCDYTPAAIDHILGHAIRHGTVEMCSSCHPDHRALLEATLPRSERWQDPTWNDLAYTLAD